MANIVVHIDTSHPEECKISFGAPKEVGSAEKLAVQQMVEAIGQAAHQGNMPKIAKLDSAGN